MSGAKSAQERREHLARMRAGQQSQERRRRVIIYGLGALVVVLLVGFTAYGIIGNRQDKVIEGLRSYDGLARDHVDQPVSYPQNPPVGGKHAPIWLNCGVYSSPVHNENAVHSLEHGAVWITYRPDLASADVTRLRDLVGAQNPSSRSYMILSPFAGLPAPVVASAWGKQVQLTGAADPNLEKFIRQFVQGPQTPEPGASCTGGVGQPDA
jgi:hypothetical protein